VAIKVVETALKDTRLIMPDVFRDERGFFKETYSSAKYHALGIDDVWLQDNVSRSIRNTIRGMHGDPRMAKLVQALHGSVWDVIVDMRQSSPTYRKWPLDGEPIVSPKDAAAPYL
jgi:dTDP-4-dehydrorhamnose 3,5-epimerase